MGESGCCVVVGYAPKFLGGDLVKCEWTWQSPARDLVNFNFRGLPRADVDCMGAESRCGMVCKICFGLAIETEDYVGMHSGAALRSTH
jgi:hypothetical protein